MDISSDNQDKVFIWISILKNLKIAFNFHSFNFKFIFYNSVIYLFLLPRNIADGQLGTLFRRGVNNVLCEDFLTSQFARTEKFY